LGSLYNRGMQDTHTRSKELLFVYASDDFLPLARDFLTRDKYVEAMTLLATPENNTLWKEVEYPHPDPLDGLPTLTSAFFYYPKGLIYVEADAHEHTHYTRQAFELWQVLCHAC
jgi:hypothetical protein